MEDKAIRHPSDDDVIISVGVERNKTIIELNIGLHPQDVEMLQEKILRMCLDEFEATAKFVKNFNKEIEDLKT